MENKIEETLCRFDSIEAKCRAGMIDDLVAGYDAALQSLQESLAGTGSETGQAKCTSTLLDRLKGFSRFVKEQADYFRYFGQYPGFCAQQAYNMFRDGPVAEAASAYLADLSPEVCVILHHEENRDAYVANLVKLQVMKGHDGFIHSVALSADGRVALSGGQDEPIFVWDVKTGRCAGQLDGHIGRVKAVALSADGKIAISAGWDKTMRVWDVDSGECINIIAASDDYIDTAALSIDGKTAVTGDQGGAIKVWDIRSGKQLHLFEGDPEHVHAVALSADGTLAVSAGKDRQIKVWNTHTGSRVQIIPYSFPGEILALSLSSDGSVLVSGGDDQTVNAWDTCSPNHVMKMTGHTGPVVSVAVSADGRMALSASKDRTIRLWDIKKGECLRILNGHSDYPKSAAMSGDGRIAVSGSDDQTVIVWNLANGTPGKQEIKKDIHPAEEYFSMDGQVMVSGKLSDTLRIVKKGGGDGEHLIKVDEEIKVLNVSPDGRIVVTAPWGSILYLWDAATGRSLGKLEGHSGSIKAAALSIDGTMMISADGHDVLRAWDVETKSCLNVFPCRARSVAISPDGNFILAGGSDGIIRVWNTMTGICLRKWKGHTGEIHSLTLSPHGNLVFSTASDKTLRVWDVKENRCIAVKGHHCEIANIFIVNGMIKVSDFSGCVTSMTLYNRLLPSYSPVEIRELLARCDDRFLRLSVPPLDGDMESSYREMKWKCNVCGNRINMDVAKSRGLTRMGIWDCLGQDYCYFFAMPVTPQKRYIAKCPHWVSYEILNFDTELKLSSQLLL
ncbi:MAG: WD40 repeat domain-containing protein [Acidobacteria bacterium]|jgi:WD40 repeat protein|nr:WD40 repeat domain-containing protein [Acidobacteriota bacterium]